MAYTYLTLASSVDQGDPRWFVVDSTSSGVVKVGLSSTIMNFQDAVSHSLNLLDDLCIAHIIHTLVSRE